MKNIALTQGLLPLVAAIKRAGFLIHRLSRELQRD